MSALSTDDLVRLRDSITRGPWYACAHLKNDNENGCGCGYRGVVYGPDGGAICQPGHEVYDGEEGLEPHRYPREQEVANMRGVAFLPGLLSELIRLRGEVEAMRAVVETALAAPTTGESHV